MKKNFIFAVSAIIFLSFFAGAFAAGTLENQVIFKDSSFPPALLNLQKKIMKHFFELGADLSHNVDELAKHDLKSDKARSIISAIFHKNPYILNCALVDLNGSLVTIEPAEYKSAEGKNISDQAHYKKLRETKKPVLSNVFKAVEGFDAFAMQYPILNEKKELAGSLSMLVKPEIFFCRITEPQIKGFPVKILVVQPDGLVLYSQSSGEVGLNVFTDGVYKNVRNIDEIASSIKTNESGSAVAVIKNETFSPESTSDVNLNYKKRIFWSTIGLFDTRWRVISVTNFGNEKYKKDDQASPNEELKKLDENLRSLSKNPQFIKSVAGSNTNEVMLAFKGFYEHNYEVYSIQWVDKSGVCRYGYPLENSVIDYDFHAMRLSTDYLFLTALDNKVEKEIECRLIEGNTGIFKVVPLFDGNNFLGILYYIRLKKNGK